MNLEKGYIALTNNNWCNFCSSMKLSQVNVWIRRKSFKAIPVGSPIFFLEKGTRLVRGYGTFKIFEIDTLINTWFKYKEINGAPCYQSFLETLKLPYNDLVNEKEIGNILVENVVWSNKEVAIDNINIPFHKATVSGKTLTNYEVDRIINSL